MLGVLGKLVAFSGDIETSRLPWLRKCNRKTQEQCARPVSSQSKLLMFPSMLLLWSPLRVIQIYTPFLVSATLFAICFGCLVCWLTRLHKWTEMWAKMILRIVAIDIVRKKNAGLRISFSVNLVLLFKLRFLPFLMQKKKRITTKSLK